MDKSFVDQVIIKLGDRYVIAATKDHNFGIVVQVARLNPTHVRGDNGAVYKGHEPVVMWQQIVSLGNKNAKTNEIDFRDIQSIDSDLKAALGKAQQYAQKCLQVESGVDALLVALDKEVNK
jgi:hypothetical protein